MIMPEAIENQVDHATVMADSRAAVITHAEKAAGKPFDEITYNQLRVMRGFNTSLETRAVLSRLVNEKLRAEQAAENSRLFSERIGRWVANLSPADQVVHYGEGLYGLTKDGGI